MKVTVIHPTGNANVRAALAGFYDARILEAFYTCIATFKGDISELLSKFPPLSELKRRQFDKILKPYTKIWPVYESGRLLSSRLGLGKLIKHESGLFSVDAVYKNLDRHVASAIERSASNGQGAVYAYEDGAVYSFKKAKQYGLQCLYDLPIGYWRTAGKLLESEYERWPEWLATLTGFKNSEKKLNTKDEELSLADRIYVASSFTARTLIDFPGQLPPVEVIPYGFPEVCTKPKEYSYKKNRALKLLFVGGLTQRKGLADLFAVADKLGRHIELTVVGRKTSSECPALDSALVKHNWIPSLPHKEILNLMQAHDVLVFPSLFEGFGLVITEAMSQGTPVITTNRTAGPDLITHNKNGWLIEAGDSNLLLEAIEKLLDQPDEIESAGKEAVKTAKARPWSVYGEELAASVNKHLSSLSL